MGPRAAGTLRWTIAAAFSLGGMLIILSQLVNHYLQLFGLLHRTNTAIKFLHAGHTNVTNRSLRTPARLNGCVETCHYKELPSKVEQHRVFGGVAPSLEFLEASTLSSLHSAPHGT